MYKLWKKRDEEQACKPKQNGQLAKLSSWEELVVTGNGHLATWQLVTSKQLSLLPTNLVDSGQSGCLYFLRRSLSNVSCADLSRPPKFTPSPAEAYLFSIDCYLNCFSRSLQQYFCLRSKDNH